MEAQANGQEETHAHHSLHSLSEKIQKRFGFERKPLLFITIFVIIASVLFIVSTKFLSRTSYEQTPKEYSPQDHGTNTQNDISAQWPILWGAPDNQYKCQKNVSVKYSALPVALEDITFVQPIGELREGHIIPGDHGGIDYTTSPTSTPVKVFMPADGFLVRVEKHPYEPPQGYPRNLQHYHVYLEHSCTLFTGFVHLTEFSPEILAASSELEELTKYRGTEQKQGYYRIPLKAGQQLGTAWSFGLLGIVTVDLNVINTGYLKAESYNLGENWRMHSVPMLDYFEEPIRSKIMAKNPRTAEPRGGKIDFDIEGKLVGNWFEEGTNGLKGIGEKRQCGNWPCPYWEGHLAFVYDYIDPTQLRVSIGYQHGLSGRTPFGVKGNAPDFKNIGASEGIVRYELVGLKDMSREKGYDTETSLITVNDESKALGALLAQVVDADTIKVEVFPNKVKDQVSAFTQKAKIYHR